MEKQKLSRRTFIGNCTTGIASIVLSHIPASSVYSNLIQETRPDFVSYQICAFSKMFDFLGKDMFAFLADAGFDGVDLTVRPGGFISYEQIEKRLAGAVNDAGKRGLSIPMIATDIIDASDAVTQKVLKSASEIGIKSYRMGYFTYNEKFDIPHHLEVFKNRLKALSELNEKYGIQGNYQNHVGGMFGSAIWDLWTVIKELDVRFIACQYDIRHAVAEGLTSWKPALKSIIPYIGTLCIKDFVYEERKGKWGVKSVPLGTGVVDFNSYMKILKENKVQVPMSIHFEFPLLTSADTTLSKKEKIKKMLPVVRREVETLKEFLKI